MRNSAAKDAKGGSPARRNGTKERPRKDEKVSVAKKSLNLTGAGPKSRAGTKTPAKAIAQSKAAKKTPSAGNGRGGKNPPVAPAGKGKSASSRTPTPVKAAPTKAAPTRVAAPPSTKGRTKAAKTIQQPVTRSAARSAASPRGGKAVLATPAKAPARSAKVEAPSLGIVVKAFEAALKAFHRGNFKEARDGFENIIQRFPHHTDIIARVNTYLAICRNRTTPAPHLPQTADSLYDRGVVELNNWNYDAAVTLFERALKGQSGAPHILYSLAAAQIRVGRVDEGLRNLEHAIEARDRYRYQARRDPDFAALRAEPRFLELVGILYEADAY
jgi:outer membrane protein assembly factor BamD (BamD/ComL family)